MAPFSPKKSINYDKVSKTTFSSIMDLFNNPNQCANTASNRTLRMVLGSIAHLYTAIHSSNHRNLYARNRGFRRPTALHFQKGLDQLQILDKTKIQKIITMGKYKQFIIDAANNNTFLDVCSEWRGKLKEKFPELFEKEFKEGDWIVDSTCDNETIEKITSIENGRFKTSKYGDDDNGFYTSSRCFRKATKEEVESHLISEAKKRGLIDGVFIKSADQETSDCPIHFSGLVYSDGGNDFLTDGHGNTLYEKGEWAKIIKETISKERAEELLEHKYQIA